MSVIHEEKLLIENVRRGDKHSYEVLFHKYFSELSLLSYRIVRNKVVAEEIVQDFFVKCWIKREDLWISTSFKAYSYRSVYNLSLNFIRDNKKFTSLENVGAAFVDESEMGDDYSSDNTRLQAAIESLPPQCRRIFTLICVEGLSYAEVAEELGLSVNTIKVQMSKAYRLLRESLSVHSIIYLAIAFMV
ncbi:RNA polymerase sigma-70 factor [Alistipes sp. ZOR0009]|jgi:RNA polymerase sigma-70 factor (ECF subfamily)|uniref:RNA polymerase sigma-70 factor n=1 Tax=Alistipes sp. ZOR0009 TaxID=1339253 RepID=UPI00069132D9|nr:RNA polymerase sigma-70 factor [Alistipes sp. ZOR0009]